MKQRESSDCFNLDRAVVDIWKRQIGQIPPRTFASRVGASEDLVLRLDLHKKLANNNVWTTTVGFSSDGDMLVSGGTDGRVVLWDWHHGNVKLSFPTGHNSNVFQAKFMPFANERSMVTCGGDGQVRHAMILDSGHHVDTKLLAKHEGRVHKLAIEHGSPYIFYSCGTDGLVQHFDLRTGASTKLFTCQTQRHDQFSVVQLNAIAIDPRRPSLFAVAGRDEYTRLYDFRKYKQDGSSSFGQPAGYLCPENLIGNKNVHITGLAFSDQSELLASYRNDFIYLFTKDPGLALSNLASSKFADCDSNQVKFDLINNYNFDYSPQVYNEHRNHLITMGVNFFGPRCDYVISGSDCGRIFIWRKKNGELLRVLEEGDRQLLVTCVEPHPHTACLSSIGHWKGDIKLWIPKALERVKQLKKIGDDNADSDDDDHHDDGDDGGDDGGDVHEDDEDPSDR